MKKVIGIISYLPDDKKIRDNRKLKLSALITKCNQIFNLPIIVIAQNWSDSEISYFKKSSITFYRYPKLGIVGARNTLRKHFLESEYDYLIMIDDDSKILGTPNDGLKYLEQLEEHKSGFGEFNQSLLKLFAISKDIFKEQDFDENIQPENEGGFEDRIFVNKLRKRFPNSRFIIKHYGLSESSISTEDPDSTWYKNQNTSKMLEKTLDVIKNINEENS